VWDLFDFSSILDYFLQGNFRRIWVFYWRLILSKMPHGKQFFETLCRHMYDWKFGNKGMIGDAFTIDLILEFEVLF